MLILDHAAALDRMLTLVTDPTVPELFLLSAPTTHPPSATTHPPSASLDADLHYGLAPPPPSAPVPAAPRTLVAAVTADAVPY